MKIYAKSSNASQTLVVQPEGSSQAAIGAYVTKTATNNEGWLTYSFTSVPGNVALLYIYTQQAGTLDLFEIQVDGYSGTTPPPGIPSGLTATGGNTKVDLNWTAVSGATSYNVKRSTTAGGPYTPIATNVTGTTYTDTAVINGTTYYYIVTAVNAVGESANSNEASATPAAPVTNRALLVITLVNGLEKEYDLSMDEVNAFINWYNGRAGGTGSEVYAFNKNFNLANFLSRKEYISYSKIETFEVNEYKVTQP
ncbi:fibronectin type III domain-containing protein [Paenibacillus sp. P26]|nr:fibronectin type III domain-containing protein [Paenibacillus sp. P26]